MPQVEPSLKPESLAEEGGLQRALMNIDASPREVALYHATDILELLSCFLHELLEIARRPYIFAAGIFERRVFERSLESLHKGDFPGVVREYQFIEEKIGQVSQQQVRAVFHLHEFVAEVMERRNRIVLKAFRDCRG